MVQGLVWATLGTGFLFLMTMTGALTVFLFHEKNDKALKKLTMGFAAGIMMAASVWSLILPAIEQAGHGGGISWIPPAVGISLGAVFIVYADRRVKCYTGNDETYSSMVLAVLLHNIPEGMAVGLAFSLAAESSDAPEYFAAALALTFGIGLQNFPEGVAVVLPLVQKGMDIKKALGYGLLSAVVEPIAGIIVVLISGWVRPLMPWCLSFAAGAMLYVVVDELSPEANKDDENHKGTMGAIIGFVVMMILDVALA